MGAEGLYSEESQTSSTHAFGEALVSGVELIEGYISAIQTEWAISKAEPVNDDTTLVAMNSFETWELPNTGITDLSEDLKTDCASLRSAAQQFEDLDRTIGANEWRCR